MTNVKEGFAVKTKKIRAEDIIFFLFCIFNTYILPPVVDGNFDRMYKNETQLFKNVEKMQAFGGSVGCFVLMFGAAAYSFYAAKKRADFGRDRPILISLSVFVPLGLVTVYLILKGWLDGFEFAGGYMPFIFAAAGIWLGRLLAGRYKGVRQFYIADIIYIILCLALAVLFMIFEKRNVVTDEISVFFAVTLAVISFMYGRFSEFEYMQERLLRAVTVSAAIFAAACAPFLVTGFAGNFTSCCAYMSKYIFNTGSIAAIGVVMGYYLRIMRLGGDEAGSVKKQKRIIIINTVFMLLLFLAYTAYSARYFVLKSENVYKLLDADGKDINTIYYSDGNVEFFTVSNETIEKMLDVIKTENGVKVSELPRSHDTDGYEMTAYDKNGMAFVLKMHKRGELSIEINTNIPAYYGIPADHYNVVIPKQFYGFSPTNREEYLSIMKTAAKPTFDDKMKLITGSSQDMIRDFPDFWEELIKDPDVDIRLAAVENINDTALLTKLAQDKDKDVKAAAYEKLKAMHFSKDFDFDMWTDTDSWGRIDEFSELAENEPDEVYRFYAVNLLAYYMTSYAEGYLGEKVDADWLYLYLNGEYENSHTDIDKLTYKCAMKVCGYDGYYEDIGRLAEALPDEGKYAEIKKTVRDMFG